MGLNCPPPQGKKGLPGAVSRQSLSGISLFRQSAADIGQIQELQLQLEEAKKEKHKLQEQVRACRLPPLSWGRKRGAPSRIHTVGRGNGHSFNFSLEPDESRAVLDGHTHTLTHSALCPLSVQRCLCSETHQHFREGFSLAEKWRQGGGMLWSRQDHHPS